MSLFGGNVGSLTAIDVHVHLEPEQDNRIDDAAKKYFGDSGATRDHKGMAEYYGFRKIPASWLRCVYHLLARFVR